MSKALHDIDNLFYEALEKNAELPSASVKEKLMAALDKQDADSNRRRFIWWRRLALLLLLLLAGYVLFDSVVLKTGKGKSNEIAVTNKSATASENNTDNKEIFYTEQSAVQPETNKTTGVSIIPEANPFFNSSPSSVLFNLAGGTKEKMQNPAADFIADFPKTFSDYLIDEISNPLSYPIAISQRTSGNISFLLPKPASATPSFSSIKLPGNKFHPYWQFSLFASYDRTGYRLDSDDPVTISNIKHSEVHEPSFSAGALLTRQFSRHWGLQTGLIYSYTGIGISPQKIYAFQDPAGDISYKYITSSGYAYIKPAGGNPAIGDSLTVESKHQLKTINIPLSVKYKIGNNKLTVSPGAGVEAGFITSAKSEVELTDASNHETRTLNKLSGTKKFYWSAIANVELQYKLTSKTSITIQPSYRQALSPITKNNVVETFPRSFGIRAGITIRL